MPTLRHSYFDRSLLWKLLPALGIAAIVIIALLLPGSNTSLGYHLRHASAESSDILDTTADKVYGQATFTATAAFDPPTAASLHTPADVVMWAESGQVFVADPGNNRVLIWDDLVAYQNGDLAGTVIGQTAFERNDAPNPPTASSLNQPSGVELDDAGNLYVADTGNQRVLRYEPEDYDEDGYLTFSDGQVADLVVGQANFTSNAAPNPPNRWSLNHPMGIMLDYFDNLVVADRDNNRVLIFRSPLVTGMYASAVLGQPADPSGYLGDFNSNAAPNPPTAVSLNHPTGVAIGTGRSELFVADTGNHRVLAYTRTPFDPIADAVIGQPDFVSNTPNKDGLSGASLASPAGVRVDSGGRLLVADRDNHRVLGFDDPFAAAPTADVVFGQGGSFTTGVANKGGVSADSLNAPVSIATDEAYMNLYVADQGNNRVLQFDQPLPNPIPAIVELYPGMVQAGGDAFDLEIWGAGIISGTTVTVNGALRPATVDLLGVIIVTLSGAEIAQPGLITFTLANPGPGGGVSAPVALTVYVSAPGDTTADSVLGQSSFSSDWGAFEPVDDYTLDGPTHVALDRSTGRVFVADLNNLRVLSWPSSTAHQNGESADLVIGRPDFAAPDPTVVTTTARLLQRPLALGVDQAGNLYVTDPQNHRVLLFRAPLSNGMAASVVIGQPDFTSGGAPATPTAANLDRPYGLAVDGAGNLYVADRGYNRVLLFRTPLSNGMAASHVWGQGGSFTTGTANKDGISANSLNNPYGMSLDPTGQVLYLADSLNNRVLAYDSPLTGEATADRVFGQRGNFTTNSPNNGGISASSLAGPTHAAADPAGRLYVVDKDNQRVLAYSDPANRAAADLVFGQHGSFTTNQPNNGGLDADSLSSPRGADLDGEGNLYVGDTVNNRVLVYLRPFYAPPTTIYLPAVTKGGQP